MFRKVIIATLTLIGSLSAFGSDFSLSITSAPRKVPQGAPVSVTVVLKNVSGHPVTVARGYGGFEYTLNIVRADGNQRTGCKPPPVATYIPGFKKETLPADWCQTRVVNITCDDVPGEWIVQAVLSCQGPYPIYKRGQVVELFKGWNGEIKSKEVRIKIVKPQDVDLEAFNYFKGCPLCDRQEVLKLFPTSTYVGYALTSLPTNSTPITRSLAAFRDPDEAMRAWADQGGGEEQVRQTTQQAKSVMENYAKSAALFLSAHPGSSNAPLIRRAYAMCLGLTGHMPEALDQIRILAQGQGKEAEEAKAFLAEKESKKGKN